MLYKCSATDKNLYQFCIINMGESKMERNNLIKKGVVIAVILLFIGTAITPICAAQSANSTENINNKSLGHYFGSYGNIRIIYNATACSEPIIPLTGEYVRIMKVDYMVNGIFAEIISKFLRGRMAMRITLSVEDVPDYASVMVTPNVVDAAIDTRWNSEQCYVHISVNEDAPAYETSYFTLKATSVSIKGPLGLLTWIHNAEYVQDIPFVPAYLPIIDIIPETYILETPPGKISQLNITMKNLGNGLTIIDSKILNFPSEEWWGYIQPETILDIGESKVVSLLLLAPENYSGYNQIEIASTGRYYFYDPENFTASYGWILTVFYNP